MAIRGVDISGLQQAYAQLGQSNAILAQREMAERAKRAQMMQGIGSVAGFSMGGPEGAAIGGLIGGGLAGESPSSAQLANLAIMGMNQDRQDAALAKQEDATAAQNQMLLSQYDTSQQGRTGLTRNLNVSGAPEAPSLRPAPMTQRE